MDIAGLMRDSETSAARNRFKAADEIDRLRRERDDYRDMLKGIQLNIRSMLRPAGTDQEDAGNDQS